MGVSYTAVFLGAYVLTCSPLLSTSSDCPSAEYNAFEFLESFVKGIIKYATFNTTMRCVRLSRLELNETNKFALYQVKKTSFPRNDSETSIHTYQVQPCPDMYSVLQDGNTLYNSRVIYSDYSNCTVVMDGQDPTACLTFISAGASEDTISACREKIPSGCSCAFYDIYDPAVCAFIT